MPRTNATSSAGIASPQPVVPGSAQTRAAAATVTRNEMPVLVTTSSIVMYLTSLRAYGDGAVYGEAYGSVWGGGPWAAGAPPPQPGVPWPFTARAKPRPKAGLLLGIVISSR